MTDYPTGGQLVATIPSVVTADLVSTGGQKAVYRATIEGEVVALKVIALDDDEVTDDEDTTHTNVAIERAKREASILQQVNVSVLARSGPLGLSTIQLGDVKWIYFTEEWIEGETLRTIIKQRKLLPKEVARAGVDLVQAACWLSHQGLVHRDIKPANIMLASDRSTFVLLDPGIALDLYGPSLTQVPALVGTLAYLSPEQMDPYRKRSLDFRSDLFAIGIVLYEAAVGEHPFRSVHTTPSQVLAGILTLTPQPVADRVADFPRELSEFISRLLGKAPHLRYRTCDRALLAIEQITASLGVNE